MLPKLSQINNLDIIGVRTLTAGLPPIIRLFTNRYVNHLAGVVKRGNNIKDITAFEMAKNPENNKYESVETPLEHYIEGVKVGVYQLIIYEPDTDELTITPDSEMLWLDYVANFKGKIKYDYANLLCHQLVRVTTQEYLGMKTGIWIGRRGKAAEKRQQCQELMYSILKASTYGMRDKDGATNLMDLEQYIFQVGNLLDRTNIEQFINE